MTNRNVPPYEMECLTCGFLAYQVLEAQKVRIDSVAIMAAEASITHRMLAHSADKGKLPW